MKTPPPRPAPARLCLAVVLAGCWTAAPARGPLLAQGPPSPPPPAASPRPGGLLPPGAASRSAAPTPAPSPAVEIAACKTADELYNYVLRHASRDPGIPPGLAEEVGKEKMEEFKQEKLTRLLPACTEFRRRYPNDPRRWQALLTQLYFTPEDQPGAVASTDYEKELESVVHAADAAPDAREEARSRLITLHFQNLQEKSAASTDDAPTGLPPALLDELAAFERDFPNNPRGEEFVGMRVSALKDTAPAEIPGTLAALARSPNRSTAQAAKARQATLDFLRSPLTLKFTTLDGTAVDFARLRGQVVVLHFWATWNQGSLETLSGLVDLRDQLKARGGVTFVGVSLDQSGDRQNVLRLLALAKKEGLDWVQYFDGHGMQNAVASKFSVDSLPTIWLVDKKGFAHELKPESSVAEEVNKLLAQS